MFESHLRPAMGRRGPESFVLVWNRRAASGSGTIGEEFSRRIAVQNDSTYTRRETGTFTDGTVSTYIDPSGVYRRTEAANGSVETEAFPGGTTGTRTRFALLVGAVAELRFVPNGSRVGTTEREGARYLQLFSTNPPEYLVTIYSEYDLREFQSTIWVHPDGYVRTVQYELTLVNGTERIDVAERYTYTDVGQTTLERPAWATGLDPANRSVTARDGTATPAGTATSSGTTTPTPDGAATPTPTETNDTAAGE